MSFEKDIKQKQAARPERHQEGRQDYKRNGPSSETPQPKLAENISPAVASSMWVAEELSAMQKEFEAFLATSRARLFQSVQREFQFQLSQAIQGINGTDASEHGLPKESGSNGFPYMDSFGPEPQASQNGLNRSLSDGASLTEDIPHSSFPTPLPAQETRREGPISVEEALLVNPAVAPQEVSVPIPPTHNGIAHGQGVERELDTEEKPAQLEASLSYQEIIHISVNPGPGANQALQFVDDLCKLPKVRLQRLVGSHKAGLDLWLLLREQMDVQNALQEMQDVAAVSRFPDDGNHGPGHRLVVQLR